MNALYIFQSVLVCIKRRTPLGTQHLNKTSFRVQDSDINEKKPHWSPHMKDRWRTYQFYLYYYGSTMIQLNSIKNNFIPKQGNGHMNRCNIVWAAFLKLPKVSRTHSWLLFVLLCEGEWMSIDIFYNNWYVRIILPQTDTNLRGGNQNQKCRRWRWRNRLWRLHANQVLWFSNICVARQDLISSMTFPTPIIPDYSFMLSIMMTLPWACLVISSFYMQPLFPPSRR